MTTHWSCSRCMIWSHTVVLPLAVPPAGRHLAVAAGPSNSWQQATWGHACHSNEEACPPSKGGPAPQWARACMSEGQVTQMVDAIQVWGPQVALLSPFATHSSQGHTHPRGSHSSSWESDCSCLVGWWVPRCHGHWQCSAASDPWLAYDNRTWLQGEGVSQHSPLPLETI